MLFVNIIRDLGYALISALTALGEGAEILWTALLGIGTRSIHAGKRVWDQLALVGFESLPIVLITMMFSGMVFGLQITRQFVMFGAGQFVGGVVAVSMARELAPTLVGIVVAARIGSAFAVRARFLPIASRGSGGALISFESTASNWAFGTLGIVLILA